MTEVWRGGVTCGDRGVVRCGDRRVARWGNGWESDKS